MNLRTGETLEGFIKRRDRYAGAICVVFAIITFASAFFLPRWLGAIVVLISFVASHSLARWLGMRVV